MVNLNGKPSNIYYKSIVKLTKSSINLTKNRYAQSIVKFAMIFNFLQLFLRIIFHMWLILLVFFHKITKIFENFTVFTTNLTLLFVGLGNSMK